GNVHQIDRAVQRLAASVNAQYGIAPDKVWAIEHNPAIETPGAQQRRIEHVGAVRRGDDDHIGMLVEAIHLDQNLVERLLAFVVPAADANPALAADGINLINKNDAGGVAFRFLEQVAHA